MLEVKQLYKAYPVAGGTLPVLWDVSFTVEEGEFYMILGRSGCGKTTLLRLLGGFEKPDGGQILLDGQEVNKPSPRQMMVFQSFDQLFPWYTLRENLIYAMKRGGVGRNAGEERKTRKAEKAMLEERMRKYLKLAELSDFADSYPHQLSGGMKQRGALARALCLEPEMMLLDEPFSSLDYVTKKESGQRVKEMAAKTGCTAVMVTHDIEEALELGTVIAVMGKENRGLKAVFRKGREGFPSDLKGQLEAYLR